MKIPKPVGLIIVFLSISFNLCSQPSYDSFIAFRLFDENRQLVDAQSFSENYELSNVFADKVIQCQSYSWNCFYYDSVSTYFFHHISTISSLFSFAIYHNDKVMAIFLPFSGSGQPYYAVDSLKFQEGNYLLDFPLSTDTVRYFWTDYIKVGEIDLGERNKAFLRSEYVGAETRYYKE